MKKSEIKALIKEVLTEAVPVPSNVMEFAKRKGPYAVALVKKAATWAKKSGRDISGGTAIGKNYSTIVLDMKYQGSEIYINLDKETIELFDKEVTDAKSFAKVLADNEETLREDKNNLQVKGTYLGRKGVFFNFKKDLFGRTIATFRTDDKTSGGLKRATMGIRIDKNEDVKFDDKDTKIKENQSYQGTITDDSAEYMLKDLGIKLQHQYDSISGTRFFGPLEQIKKARKELKLKYNVESKIDQSSIDKFGYSELHVPNQTVD
jgi:hypothetical protein